MERNGYLHCPMCGMEFKRADTACAHGCPLGRGCNLVCCPSCRYEFPPQGPALSWLRRLLRRRGRGRPAGGAGMTLESLRAGQRARLAGLNCSSSGRRNTLTVFGLVPGVEVTLLQRRPSYVVRVGQTELGMDAEIAREILVERGGPTDLAGSTRGTVSRRPAGRAATSARRTSPGRLLRRRA